MNLDFLAFKIIMFLTQIEQGQLAQSVEQGPEKPRVGSSILSLPTIFLYIYDVLFVYSFCIFLNRAFSVTLLIIMDFHQIA